MDKSIQMLEADMQMLSRMSKGLFEAWQDKLSEHFQKGCFDEMERHWKKYQNDAEQLLYLLEKNEKEVEQYLERSKKR